jgi:hypothetical protein
MRRPEAGILALAILAACAIPTDSPNWDMTWNLPVPDKASLSVGVGSFLPNGVTTIGTPPTMFAAAVSATPPINRTLGANCPSCPSGTAPKPAFTAPLATTTISLTAGTSLQSGTLTTGSQLVIAVTNNFAFDPIKPPGGAAGTITFTLDNGGITVGNPLVISGTSSAIPAGQTTSFTMPLTGPISTASPLTVKMTMDSPAGAAAQPVAMSPTQTFNAVITPTLRLSTVAVNIAAQPISSALDSIDMGGIQSVRNRIADTTTVEGFMYLTVNNPFTVGGAMTVTFAAQQGQSSFTPITKNVPLAAAANGTTPSVAIDTIALTGHELRQIVGGKITTSFGGTTGSGSLTATPTQEVTMTSRMQLTLSIKENK